MAKRVMHLNRKSGPLFTALYLKQCAVSLQQAYLFMLGFLKNLVYESVPVSLTRTGYRKIIPSYHRKLMRVKESRYLS